MSVVRHDRIQDFDIDTISFEDIHWQYGTGNGISKGEGRNKERSYRSGVMTKMGDIREDVWYRLVEKLIEREGEQVLQDALLKWAHEHNSVKDKESTLREIALQEHCARIFDDPLWVSYLQFNKRFRPEVYERAKIVNVKCDCCGLPGEVTQERLNYDSMTVCCPNCNRWSAYSIISKENHHG